jgi:hypothetical protein
MKLKGLAFADIAEIQVVTNELKKVQKRNIRLLFGNCTTSQKPVYMPVKLISNKKIVCLPHVSSIFLKKKVLKLLDCTVY